MIASALLLHFYADGGLGWVLGFVALAPWLRSLDATRSLAGTLLVAWAFAMAYAAAVFAWFGVAIGSYTQWGTGAGLAALLLAAPLLQPQILAFALVRHLARRHLGPWARAFAGASAWVAAESLLPRLLGDSLGHGLYPSMLLRQAADLGGAAGLSLLLLLSNEAVAAGLGARGKGARAIAQPLAAALVPPLLLAGYGLAALAVVPADPGRPLRVGLVQSNIVDYERLRRDKGAAAVVREVLDTHYAMSYDAVERQRVDAVLWSETVYPTTFGSPKSEAGAELDREILSIVQAAGVPFVFGTYDRDAQGEYNAAAFVAPGSGVVGLYRKARPFPLTEHVPSWLDGATLRRWLPWAGNWQPGDGARVFPLRLADGREIPVQPLICLDAVDPQLAIDGARLGAQALLSLSNDAWFVQGQARGAALHLAVAAFRSIETRLPQFRVTTNGVSAVIDAQGRIVAASRPGERTLVIGALTPREPAPTLMVAWGDWVGRAAAAFLALLLLAALWRSRDWRQPAREADGTERWPVSVCLLPGWARLAAATLTVLARCGLLWMAGSFVLGSESMPGNTLALLRSFALVFLVPACAAWCVRMAFRAKARVEGATLVFWRGGRRLDLALGDIGAVQPWRLPLPCDGASLHLTAGGRWRLGLAVADPRAFARSLHAAGGPPPAPEDDTLATRHARLSAAGRRGRLRHPLVKFGLFPLLLALPAFRLHQHIAYGGSLGEWQTFGGGAFLLSLVLWWATWIVAVVLVATVLRTAIEAATLAALLWPGRDRLPVRQALERLGLAALYLGPPVWLLLRVGSG